MPETKHRSLAWRILRWVLMVLALLIVGLALFIVLFDFSGRISSYGSKASGRKVELGGKIHAEWSMSPKFRVEKVRIGNMEGGTDPMMFTADAVVISIDAEQLLHGHLVFPVIEVDKGDLLLEKDAKGNANWKLGSNPEGKMVSGVAPKERTDIPAIGRLVLKEGHLRYKDPAKKTNLDTKISTVIGSVGRTSDIRIDGKGNIQGQPFTLNYTGGSVLTLQDTDEPYPLDVTFAAGNTWAHIKGTVMDPIALKGLELGLHIKGASMADLFPLTGIALPPTPPYDVDGNLGFKDKVWTFSSFTGKMGGSDLGGDLSFDTGRKRPYLKANFLSQRLAFGDLGGFVGGTPKKADIVDPKQKAVSAHREASAYVIPDVPLDISRLSAMDADITFTGKQIIATKLPLDDFTMKAHLDDRLLKLDPLKFGTADGDINAILTVNARETPVAIDGDFKFHHLSLQRLFAPVQKSLNTVPAKGFIGGTAVLKGRGKSLREMLGNANGEIGVGMEGGQLSNVLIEIIGLDIAETLGFFTTKDKPTNIRCIVGDFAVKDGVMNSNTLVVDTNDTNIKGEGSINLKTEAIDIKLNPHPKDNSILSLRSPLHVGGTLKSPSYGIEPGQLIAKGVAGAALGAVLLPLGLLAFIEPGLGKDSDCAGLIHTMNGHTAAAGDRSAVTEKRMPPSPHLAK